MAEVWVCNASPLIVLARAGLLHLLQKLPDELWIPDAVAAEVQAGPEADAARSAVEGGMGKRGAASQVPASLVEWGLGAGETAVLALARERLPCSAVLDDAIARQCARVFGIPVIGTLGVLVRAKRAGMIPSAAEGIALVERAGLHLGAELIRMTLQSAGED